MLQFVLPVLLPVITQFFSVVIPIILVCLGTLMQFSLTRLAKIPSYIQVLIRIYQDSAPNSKAKKYATTGLLILGGILSFLANSLVPLTTFPVISLVTGPLAILLSLTVILLTMDLISSIDKNVFREMKARYGSDFQDIEDDILTIKTELGPRWDKLNGQAQIFFDDLSPKIDELENTLKKQGIELSNEINKYFQNELSDLVIYLSEQDASNIQINSLDINCIKESLEPWEKVSTSFLVGATGGSIAGFGTAGATTSVFAQATLGNQVLALLGLKGGILVSASAYAMLTTLAPIAVGVGLGAGIFSGSMILFQKNEEKKASKFLADVVIGALPIMHADGHVDPKEKDAIYQMMNNSTLQKEDKERVQQALNSNNSLDELVVMGIFNEQKKEKREIKRKLILTLAWEIAKADDHIHLLEIELHDRMAKIMQISEENIKEIRRLITPKLFLPTTDSPLQEENFKSNTIENEHVIEINQTIANDFNHENIYSEIHSTNLDTNSSNNQTQFQDLKIDNLQIEELNSLKPIINQTDQLDKPITQVSKDNDLNILTEDRIAQMVNEKVQEVIKIEKEKLEKKMQKKLVLKEQYKKIIAQKLSILKEKLSKNLITRSQYDLEIKEIRSHIDLLEKM
ncbi:MAG: TerB family tellurite resistance protein [Snowella sp.]|nr:TerB family tellurite resistance protein [Snowella sp.]